MLACLPKKSILLRVRNQAVIFKSLLETLTKGDPKVSGIVTKIYLKYSSNFETSVLFKVLPLWLDPAIPAMLPLLETLSKIFNRNAVKGNYWFSLNFCNISKTPPFQNLLHPCLQKSCKERGRVSGVVWCCSTKILFLAKKCWTLKFVWAGALSCCKNHSPLCHFSGWFRCRLLRKLFNTFK